MKRRIFWTVMPGQLVVNDVSKKYSALIFSV